MPALLMIMFLAAVVLAFGTFMLWGTSKLGPHLNSNDKVKRMAYECGLPGSEKQDTKVSIKYYLTAILFILFDIEVIFLFPWALIYKDFLKENGLFIFSEMMVFLAILIFGLFYVVKAKALDWE